MSTSYVELRRVSKSFPGVQALKDVDVTIKRGEIHALVGENGAGKSTLMKVLSGIYPRGNYQGEIFINGKAAHFTQPKDAEVSGIAIIHQELSCFPHLTVAENLFVGHWPLHKKIISLIHWREMFKDAEFWLNQVGANCSPNDLMKDLSVGTQQLIEIAKALAKKSEILILDEPTSSITPQESRALFRLLLELKIQKKALVYISHKMNEIFDLCDRITVLRDGQSVFSGSVSAVTAEDIVRHMVGRPMDRIFPPRPERVIEKHVCLQLVNYRVKAKSNLVIGPINLDIHKGEIVGFFGLLGAGRTELLKSFLGEPGVVVTGSLTMEGDSRRFKSPRAALKEHLIYLSEDRKQESLLDRRKIGENMGISSLAVGSLFNLVRQKKEREKTREFIERMRIKCVNEDQETQNLSGGNQQKVFISRALRTDPKVMLVDEPTRGIDVGAKYEIYDLLFRLAGEGKGIVLVSSDLPELLALSDRIVILCRGIFKGIVERTEFNKENIIRLAIGAEN